MKVDILIKLKIATIRAQQEDELPDFLAARIFAIADRSQVRRTLQADVEELIEQVSLYDTYGQTGYIGMGVNNVILEATVRRLEEKLKQCLP